MNRRQAQIMKNISRKAFGIAAVGVLAGISIFVGLRQTPPQKCAAWIDASRPVAIKAPMEVVEIGEHGELGLWLPAEAGRGWKGEAGGEADYQFYADIDGSYTIWAYCLWHDACTNAVYAQVDDSAKAILGNDPVYGKWHWVKGFDVPLKKGFHRLQLSNHSPNIAITKVFLTNNPTEVPPQADRALASVLFSDDFNGCDRGNFPLWRKVSGKWEIRHPAERGNPADNTMTGTSDGSAVVAYDNYNWQGIHLTVSVFCDELAEPGAGVGIRFATAGEDYQELIFVPSTDGQEAAVRHIRSKSGATETLAEGRVPWKGKSWHELCLDLTGQRPSLLLDGGAKFTGGQGGSVQGGIGFALHGRLTASFDNVLVQSASGNQ